MVPWNGAWAKQDTGLERWTLLISGPGSGEGEQGEGCLGPCTGEAGGGLPSQASSRAGLRGTQLSAAM